MGARSYSEVGSWSCKLGLGQEVVLAAAFGWLDVVVLRSDELE